MAYKTLDKMVRSALFSVEYTMHWYIPFLKHAADCVRELGFGIMGGVQTAVITGNDDNSFDLPCDYAAWIRVGYMSGSLTYPLVQQDNINRLRKSDGAGGYENYDVMVSGDGYYGTIATEWGAFRGGFFGYGSGYSLDTFKEIPERNQIQVHQGLGITDLYLEYAGDGSLICSTTKINPLAQATIDAYIMWKRGLGSEDAYKHQWRLLRARLDPISTEDIKRIWNNEFIRNATVRRYGTY